MNFEKETLEFIEDPYHSEREEEFEYTEFVEDPYHSEEEEELEDTEFDIIPLDLPVDEAGEEMKVILETAIVGCELIVFYSEGKSSYESDDALFMHITSMWNEEVVHVSNLGENCFTQLKMQKVDAASYELWIETITDGSPSGFDPTWILNSSEEVAEALRIFYHTGFVYDCGMGTIYGE